MVAFLRRQRLNLPVAPLAGGLIGIVVALLFALMPTGTLEDLAIDSGIAAVFAVAAPPLGFTARLVLVFLCGGGVGLVSWFALFVLLGHRAISVQPVDEDGAERAPVLRRADAHPDAPPRRPLSAIRDLGTPFLDVRAITADDLAVLPDEPVAGEPVANHDANDIAVSSDRVLVPGEPVAERSLPADLDQPLAAFDPQAIPDQPADWFPAPAPLSPAPRRQTYAPGERFETFALTPAARKVPPPVAVTPDHARGDGPRSADSSASIHALLDRLERGVARTEAAPPPAPVPESLPRTESLEDALVTLRRLAARR